MDSHRKLSSTIVEIKAISRLWNWMDLDKPEDGEKKSSGNRSRDAIYSGDKISMVWQRWCALV